jgi:multicomponent Na+:H+ antiporter subunit G
LISQVAAAALLGMGLFFFVSGTVGLLRLPDFYCRIHAMGKCETLGALLMLLGLAVDQGFSLVSLKLLLILAFLFAVNPVAAHALGRAAWVNGLPPWTREASAGRSSSGKGGPRR